MAKTGDLKTAHRGQLDTGSRSAREGSQTPEARPEKRKKTGIISGKSLSIYQEGKDRQQAPGTAYD